jgi:hypothetical protein
MSGQPPLKSLHNTLIAMKVATFERLPSAAIRASLAPGSPHCLKCRPDGTILDGHHRVHVLRTRGEDIDALSREIIHRTDA